jgi:threonine dehydratase
MMNDLEIPTLWDVLRARQVIAPYLRPTPLYPYPGLSDLTGASVWVKHENHQPVGAFKVRGGVNLIAQMSAEERARGVIAASTGNHGQSVAYAARLFGARAIIAVPHGANPGKVAAMQALGAEVVFQGESFDEARLWAETQTVLHGYRYIHSGDEPLLIAGVGTYALEILEALPDVDAIFVPIGGGSGAAGVCTVVKALRPQVQVIGVQSEAAPAAYLSWKERRLLSVPARTSAEGLATGTAFELPQRILRQHLDGFILVSEAEIRHAIVLLLEHCHNLAEGAGAAPLAGLLHLKDHFVGRRVVLVLSGGNLSLEQLRRALDDR